MKIALTGHQKERLRGKEKEVSNWIEEQLSQFDEVHMLCGGAGGSDILFGEMKFKHPEYRLELCIPVPNYRFNEIKRLRDVAEDITYMKKEWEKGLDTVRDKYMVDHCDVLLVIWDGIKVGGAYKTMKYAQKQGKNVVCIDSDLFNIR